MLTQERRLGWRLRCRDTTYRFGILRRKAGGVLKVPSESLSVLALGMDVYSESYLDSKALSIPLIALSTKDFFLVNFVGLYSNYIITLSLSGTKSITTIFFRLTCTYQGISRSCVPHSVTSFKFIPQVQRGGGDIILSNSKITS